jgi:hypothetical protein
MYIHMYLNTHVIRMNLENRASLGAYICIYLYVLDIYTYMYIYI